MKKKWIGLIIVLVIILSVIFIVKQSGTESNKIHIGIILPLTGNRANAGEDAKAGMELAFTEINQNGGINGRKLAPIYEDNSNSPKNTISAFRKLVTIDNVPLVVGPLSSSATLAVAPVAEQMKIVLFSPTVSSPDISTAGDYIFRNGVLAEQQTNKLANFCYHNLSVSKVGILYIDDDTGRGYKDTFEKFFKAEGGQIIHIDSYEKDENDFRTHLTKLKNIGVETLFVPSTPELLGLIIVQSVEMGYNTTFIANFGVEGDKLIEVAGEHADGIYFASIPIDNDFKSKLKDKYNKEASVVAALGYDSIQIVVNAIKNGGYTSEGIKKALYSLRMKGVTGNIYFDEYGDAQKEIIIKTVKNGQFIKVK